MRLRTTTFLLRKTACETTTSPSNAVRPTVATDRGVALDHRDVAKDVASELRDAAVPIRIDARVRPALRHVRLLVDDMRHSVCKIVLWPTIIAGTLWKNKIRAGGIWE